MGSKKPNRLLLTGQLAGLIGEGYKLERTIRGGLREFKQERMPLNSRRWWHLRQRYISVTQTINPNAPTFQTVVADIEAWRTRAVTWLRDTLPGTGADIFGISKFGQTGIGPVGYEYTRLVNSITCPIDVLRDLPDLIERSRK